LRKKEKAVVLKKAQNKGSVEEFLEKRLWREERARQFTGWV